MVLIPWRQQQTWRDRLNDLESIQNEINRLFDFSLSRWPERERGLLEGMWSPAVDVYDGKEALLVRADIPGMQKDKIEIVVEGKVLAIKGEKKAAEVDDKGRIRTERFYGTFHRSLTLPCEVDTAKVSAGYKNGVLEITLPKREEYKPKQIKIEVK